MKEVYDVIVLQRHCENTEFGDCLNCAIAKAAREQYPDFLGMTINVSVEYVSIWSNDKCQRYQYDFSSRFGLNEFLNVKSGLLPHFRIKLILSGQQIWKPEVQASVASKDASSKHPNPIKIIHHYVEVDRGIKEMEKVLN